jgi:hypothetical protein
MNKALSSMTRIGFAFENHDVALWNAKDACPWLGGDTH